MPYNLTDITSRVPVHDWRNIFLIVRETVAAWRLLFERSELGDLENLFA
jgi:hypothetical protein